jgi:molybdate transport system ATP-binding protein
VKPSFDLDVRLELAGFPLAVRHVTRARRLGLFGPSGSGKTSLLEAIAGWRPLADGHVAVAGRTLEDRTARLRLPPEGRALGVVAQEPLLFPHRDVGGNIAFAPGKAIVPGKTRVDERVVGIARRLDLEGLLTRSVATLSGGEARRVALARALCSAPTALLLDEPLAGLDLALRQRVLALLVALGEASDLPWLVVSHDPTELAVLCDEVLCLRAGRAVLHGPPGEVFAEVWRRDWLEGAIQNVLRGRVVSLEGDAARVLLDEGPTLVVPARDLAVGERVVLGLDSDEILVASEPPRGLSARNVLPAVVRSIDPAPSAVVLRAELGPPGPALDVLLTRGSTARLELAPGRPVHLVLKSNSVRVLARLPRADEAG